MGREEGDIIFTNLDRKGMLGYITERVNYVKKKMRQVLMRL